MFTKRFKELTKNNAGIAGGKGASLGEMTNAKICDGIERHYGFPCDIEWAFEGNKFYITQSRPITTL